MTRFFRVLRMGVFVFSLFCAFQEKGSATGRFQFPSEAADAKSWTTSVQQLRIPSKAVREFNDGMDLRDSRPDVAVSHFQKAIRLCPEYAAAYAQLGLILMSQHQWQQAEVDLRKAVATNPGSADTNDALGIFLNRRGRFAESRPILQRALQFDPRLGSGHYELGLSCWALHDYACADREARSAVALAPNFADAHVLLSASLLRSNDRDAAAEELSLALSLDPQSKNTRAILDKLEKAISGGKK